MEEYQQPETNDVAPTTSTLSSAQPIESAELGIIRELGPRRVLEAINYELRGYSYDPVKRKYEKIEGLKPLMSDEGVAKLLQILTTSISQLVTFSNFTKEQADRNVLHICRDAFPNIAIRWKEFGIASKSDIGTVQDKVFMLSQAAFNQGISSGNRNVVRNVASENISRPISQEQYQQPPQGVLSKLNPFRH